MCYLLRHLTALVQTLTSIFHLISWDVEEHVPVGSLYTLSFTFISLETDEEQAECVVSETKGTEHELILWLPDDGKCGSVCPVAFRGKKKDLM